MTKADRWRAKSRAAAEEEAVDLELPSGMVIRARRPGPAFLAGLGRLPLSLATAAREDKAVPIEEMQTERQDGVMEFAATMRELLEFCVIDPRISLTPGPEEIHPREIANEDLEFIFAWAMRGPEAVSLETFRAKRSNDRGGRDGADVPSAPIDTNGNIRPAHGSEFRPRGNRGPAPHPKRS